MWFDIKSYIHGSLEGRIHNYDILQSLMAPYISQYNRGKLEFLEIDGDAKLLKREDFNGFCMHWILS